MTDGTLLVVDDEPTELAVTDGMLSARYRVLTADSGASALELA